MSVWLPVLQGNHEMTQPNKMTLLSLKIDCCHEAYAAYAVSHDCISGSAVSPLFSFFFQLIGGSSFNFLRGR